MSNTRIRAVGDGWINPGDDRWVKPKIFKGRRWAWTGYTWKCPNHPEKKSGEISGTGASGRRRPTLKQTWARLMLHMDKYHGLELDQECLRKLRYQAAWYNR